VTVTFPDFVVNAGRHRHGTALQSPSFNFQNSEFKLYLYPNGSESAPPNYASVYLYKYNSTYTGEPSVTFRLLGLRNGEWTEVRSETLNLDFATVGFGSKKGCRCFCRPHELTSEASRSSEGSLRLEVCLRSSILTE